MKKIDSRIDVEAFYARLDLIIYKDGGIGKFDEGPFTHLESAQRVIPLSESKFLVCNSRNIAFFLDENLTPFLPGWRVATVWKPGVDTQYPEYLSVYNRETKENGIYNIQTETLTKTPDHPLGIVHFNKNIFVQEMSNQLEVFDLPDVNLMYKYPFQRIPKFDSSALKNGMSTFKVSGFFGDVLIGTFLDGSLLMFDTHKGEVLEYIQDGASCGLRLSHKNDAVFQAICGAHYYRFDAQARKLTAKVSLEPQMTHLHKKWAACLTWKEAEDNVIGLTASTLIVFDSLQGTICDFFQFDLKSRNEEFSAVAETLQFHDNKIYALDCAGQLHILGLTKDFDDSHLMADGKIVKNHNLLFESSDNKYTTRSTNLEKGLKANHTARPFIRTFGSIFRIFSK